jgi:hypothetical protein
MDFLNDFSLIKFIVFFIPGFISIKIWGLIVANDQKKVSDYVLEVISYSCFNFALFSWLILLMNKHLDWFNQHYYIVIISYLLMILIGPIIWPITIYKIRTSKYFCEHFLIPIPKSWDFFFSKREECFILIHLTNGSKIGGIYSENSYSSSYPESEDLYLEEVWDVDKNGNFIEKLKDTKGIWIPKSSYTYIEFFELNYEEE